jgi:YVTN family beta-propeller protein
MDTRIAFRHSPLTRRARRALAGIGVTALLAGCHSDRVTGATTVAPFLQGTIANHQIGIVVNSTGRSLTLFQLGAPTVTRQVALGASNAITPVGLSVRGTTAAVSLGDAASVALVDLNTLAITRYLLFPGGNATGQAFVDDTTVLAANPISGVVGEFTVNQASDTITDTVALAPSPTDIVVAGNSAFIISGNLDVNYNPIGNGVVTKINARTLAVLDTVSATGTNSAAGAIGPDGHLYVVNTTDYVNPGSVTVIDTGSLAVITTIPNVGVGPGTIAIDGAGLAYISSFESGTIIWNTVTQAFVKGPTAPLCVLSGGTCLGAFDARPDAAGDVYQVFFGSTSPSLAPYIYVYAAGTYALTDSIAVGQGPSAIRIATF